MFLPSYSLKKLNKVCSDRYLGLDEREYINEAAFSDMLNVSSDNFPYISPRRKRKRIAEISGITAVTLPEYKDTGKLTDFTGVAGGYFYYCGEKISNIKLTDGEKEIVDFNGMLCIFPDKVYYRYIKNPDSGTIDKKLFDMEKELNIKGLRFYSVKNDDKGIYSAYIEKSGAGFDEVFKTGESIVISGASNEQNNTFVADERDSSPSENRIVSVVIDEVTENRMTLILSDKNGKRAVFTNATDKGSVSVKLLIPDMNHVCVHNNRMWGTSEDGRYIYASALGDCCNFYSYRGLANDSWYGEVGTEGKFQRIVSYRTGIAAFKENYIHQVYGDKPINFSIPKQISGGCKDGRSVSEMDGNLFFLGNDGFYVYSGGQPSKISYQLETRFVSCISESCQGKYYSCVKDKDGNSSILVFDTENSVWHKEDNSNVTGFVSRSGYIYAAINNALYCLNDDNGGESFSWSVTTKRFTSSMFNLKGLEGINLRVNAKESSELEILISYDEGEFESIGKLSGRGILSRRIPLRYRSCDCYRLKITGSGYAIIEDIERVFFTAGRDFSQGKEE